MNQRPASSRVVVEAPMSFTGSAKRLWKPVANLSNPAGKIGVGTLMAFVILMAWTMILSWYCIFGILVIPYRLLRRGSRKRKRDNLRHQELLRAQQPR